MTSNPSNGIAELIARLRMQTGHLGYEYDDEAQSMREAATALEKMVEALREAADNLAHAAKLFAEDGHEIACNTALAAEERARTALSGSLK